MTFLLSLFTNKYTWYALGGLAVAGFLYFGAYLPYENMKAQAALVPGLETQINGYKQLAASNETRAASISEQLTAARAATVQAVDDLNKWNDVKTSLDATLTEMTKHANATVNAVCQPTPAERQLWNQTIAALTGHPGAGPTPTPSVVSPSP